MIISRSYIVVLVALGLIYICLPGPKTRDQIPPLPDSVKSTEPGDTSQNPNNVGYYSDHRRGFITDFYYSAFKNLNPIGKFIPPIRLNYPPEDAFTYVKDQEKSTFLEEYLYPLRESIFVNGYEPLIKNGKHINRDTDFIEAYGMYFNSKTVVRIYSSSLISRVFIYLGTWFVLIGIFKVGRKILKGFE